MSAVAKNKSALADTNISQGARQAVDPAAFAARLQEAKGAISAAELARRSGLTPTSISEYLQGQKLPSAYNLLALADAVKRWPRWLLTGEGPKQSHPTGESEDSVLLPRFDLFDFDDDGGRGAPRDHVPLPLSWVHPYTRNTKSLWIVEAPDGPAYLARDAEMGGLLNGRSYLVVLNGRPLIARIQLEKDGLSITPTGGDPRPVHLTGEETSSLQIVGRILAEISLNPA